MVARGEEKQRRHYRSFQNGKTTVVCSMESIIKRAEDSVTRGHSWKLVKDCCRCDCRRVTYRERLHLVPSSRSSTFDINTSSLSEWSTAGTVCHRIISMQLLLTASRTAWKSEENVRWTSSKAECLTSPLAARECWVYGECWWSGWWYQVQPHPVSNPVSILATSQFVQQ